MGVSVLFVAHSLLLNFKNCFVHRTTRPHTRAWRRRRRMWCRLDAEGGRGGRGGDRVPGKGDATAIWWGVGGAGRLEADAGATGAVALDGSVGASSSASGLSSDSTASGLAGGE